MIYSMRAQPKVKESHIHKVPKSNRCIFYMGEVSGPSCSKPDLANPRLVEILIWLFIYQ